MNYKKIFLIEFVLLMVFFFNVKIVFSEGLADWKVTLFAGPGKGEEIVNTMTASDGVSGGPNKVYVLGYQLVTPDEMKRVLYEFIWTGEAWRKTITEVPSGGFWGFTTNLRFCDLRREGKKRLYFSTWSGEVFEYSYNGQAWNLDTYLPNVEGPDQMLYGFATGNRGVDDSLKIYRSSKDHQLEEYEWNGTTWEMTNFQDIYPGRPIDPYPSIDNITFGNVHGSDKNYMYFLGAKAGMCPIIELEYAQLWQETLEDGSVTWKGPGWKESSRVGNLHNSAELNPFQLFTADIGNGLKLYVIGYDPSNNNRGIFECEGNMDGGITLTSEITAGATSIPVVSTGLGFPQSGHISIEKEIIAYSSMTSAKFEGCTRGTYGTTAFVHNLGEFVQGGSVLTYTINSSATSIQVVSTSGFLSSGSIKIEDEIITYLSITPAKFEGCTRGAYGTSAEPHSLGKFVKNAFPCTRWKRIRLISLGGGAISGITYGKISWEDTDPIALYVLVTPGSSGDFSIDKADEIHEYTYDKTANKGKGAWTRTYKIKLFEEGMQPFSSVKGFPYSDFCMTNGRNETIVTPEGKTIDKYQRLYIVDTWGNVWECSIPPRHLRPGYKPEVVPDKRTPTITGE